LTIFDSQFIFLKKFAVIVAAGSGKRMGADVPKQFLLLKDKPVLWHTLNAFLNALHDIEIILVVANEFVYTAEGIAKSTVDPNRIVITVGGETRFDSVKNGLKHVNENSIVFVHDGVRCLVSEKLIHRCYDEAVEKGNAVPAIKAIDSLRIETNDGNEIIDRNKIRIMQTPQTFKSELIKPAFEQTYSESFTDEASVVESMGAKINLIEGEATNIKITQPIDLVIAERLVSSL
jgi:2-C-methyl-D-erythritol 4-phosphate cytidylyltransferase